MEPTLVTIVVLATLLLIAFGGFCVFAIKLPVASDENVELGGAGEPPGKCMRVWNTFCCMCMACDYCKCCIEILECWSD